MIVLFLSMIIQVIIPPIPAEIIVISAGKLYGTLQTTLVAGTGLYLGSILVYFFGKYINKKFSWFFDKKHIKEIIEKIRKYESLILWIRILPYNPSDIISYAAGIVHFDKKRFLSITFITSYVRCFVLASLGMSISNFQSVFGVIIILLISSFIASAVLFNHYTRRVFKMNKFNKVQNMFVVLRMALGFVMGYFAIVQFMDPELWINFIPPWAQALSPIPVTIALHIVSSLQLLVAISFVIGLFVRYFAILGVLVLIPTIIFNFPTDIAVRDFGLMCSYALFAVYRATHWSVDRWWMNKHHQPE